MVHWLEETTMILVKGNEGQITHPARVSAKLSCLIDEPRSLTWVSRTLLAYSHSLCQRQYIYRSRTKIALLCIYTVYHCEGLIHNYVQVASLHGSPLSEPGAPLLEGGGITTFKGKGGAGQSGDTWKDDGAMHEALLSVFRREIAELAYSTTLPEAGSSH